MGFLDQTSSKSSLLITAAMESAGQSIHADMLALVNGSEGQILAGFLFMTAIVSAVINLAIGGEYRWARYLLVGPPLFFFLTQVTVQPDQTEWQFGDKQFSREHIEEALREVKNPEGQTQVAMMYQFWSLFMSELSQILIRQLNLTQDGSHMDFIQKTERYIMLWVHQHIRDKRILLFLRGTMVNKCRDYYLLQRALTNPHIDDEVARGYRATLERKANQPMFYLRDLTEEENELEAWLQTDPPEGPGMEPNKGYTCDELWEAIIAPLRQVTREEMVGLLSRGIGREQIPEQVIEKVIEKFETETNRATTQVEISEEDGNIDQLVNWVVARSLLLEMSQVNPTVAYLDNEHHSGWAASNINMNFMGYRASGSNTQEAIRQFNQTEQYQHRGDLINAALALPNFQGVVLLLLTAAYPFFAMAVLIPGRAGAIFRWMELYAWVKLWDFGFAVVMMIDNILYVMFPRGPNIETEDLNSASTAWVHLLEQDPSYHAAAYYGLLSTCIFAVPLVTGVFVKGASRELLNLVQSNMHHFATELGSGSASFMRSLQGQSYLNRKRAYEEQETVRGYREAMNMPEVRGWIQQYQNLARWRAGATNGTQMISKLLGNGKMSSLLGGAGKASEAWIRAHEEHLLNKILTAGRLGAAARGSEASRSDWGSGMAESAHAARHFSHSHFAGYPGRQMLAAYTAQNYFNYESAMSGSADAAAQTAGRIWKTISDGIAAGGAER